MPKTATPPTQTPVEQELLKALPNFPAKKARESAVSYRERLVEAITADEFPVESWNKLSEPAQTWVTQGANAIASKGEVPDFPTPEGTFDEEDEEEEEEEQPLAAPTKGKGKKAPATAKASTNGKVNGTPTATAKGKAPAEPKAAPGPSAFSFLHGTVIEHPDWDNRQYEEALTQSGYTLSKSSISTQAATVKRVITLLQDGGHLKRKLI
jgi:hypothetical protein